MLNKRCLSIEFGNSNMKLLCGIYNKSKLMVKGYSIIPIPEGIIKNGYIEDKQSLVELINKELRKRSLNAKNVVFTISSNSTITREVQLPYSSNKEVEMIVRNEAAQFLPVDLKEYVYDYKILESLSNKDKAFTKVLLVAIPIKLADGYMELAQALKKRVKAIDIQVNCIRKLISNTSAIELISITNNKRQENIAIFDIGFNAVNVSIFSKGILKFTRLIQGGINDVIPIIKHEAETNGENNVFNAFERIDFNNENSDTEQAILKNSITTMFNDINRLIEFYSSLDSMDMLTGIYIYGGGSKLNGIEEEITKYFGIQAEKIQIGKALIYKGKDREQFEKQIIFLLNTLGALIR